MQIETIERRLREAGLLQERKGPELTGEIDAFTCDSRRVEEGGAFFAITGAQADGHRFIGDAASAGARLIVVEKMPEEPVRGATLWRVRSTRAAWAEVAAARFGDPAGELAIVGVTGTNGKTTTTYLIEHLLRETGRRVGLIGTIAVRIDGEELETEHTTPDAFELQRLLRRMADAGCTHAVMEVSSHALDQERVRGIDFDVACFTNLTQDHLDYHPDFGSYFAAKKKLFDGLTDEAVACYNLDDERGAAIVADTAARTLSYGFDEEADVGVAIREHTLEGMRLDLDGETRSFHLVGAFNASNLAAAYASATALGLSSEEALTALATAPPVPGRFEQVRVDGASTVIVDYAHTPDALENVLATLRPLVGEGVLWCVFGCGGDRDREKRPLMGAVAERLADRVVVTSDNPRTEDPAAILDDIRRGLDSPDEASWITDRREAIAFVAREARPGDAVLVAGKGHEPYQIVGTEKRHFDDREAVQTLFSRGPSGGAVST